MLRLGTVVIGAEDVDRAVGFWAAALGYDVVPFADADDGFTILVPPDRVGTRIALHRSTASVQAHPRVHVDLVVDTAAEQAAEVERLVRVGATTVLWDYPADPAPTALGGRGHPWLALCHSPMVLPSLSRM